MEYWIFYALGLTGLLAWWAKKESSKGLETSVTTEKLVDKPTPKFGGLDRVIGADDTVKAGTYTREKFLAWLDELLSSPEVAAELKSTDAATGVTVDRREAVKAAGVKAWDDGPTAARAAYAIDDYAAGRGVEPRPDATNSTVIWVKSGTPSSMTDRFSPAVEAKLVELAMAMRWRAVSDAATAEDSEATRAAIDEVFGRIDAAAA